MIWLEAERFDQCGGWTLDPQFIGQMGSPYLMAIGLGRPVADATTRVTLPHAGRYRLWARTEDWTPEYHPGQFQIVVDGKPAKTTFGRSGRPGWHWEDGGIVDLSSKDPTDKLEIRLHDLTGYYARCDAIILADALDFVPPDDMEKIAELRRAHGGVSPTVEEMPEHDVIVIGGGLAGCTAAAAAARDGASTVLIQNRPVLGGNASREILVPPVGAWPSLFRTKYPLDPRETGLVEEYRTPGKQHIAEGRLYSNRLLRFVKLEPNLDLHLNTHATGVEMQPGPGKQIAAVLAMDVRSGRRMCFPGKVFIDCTGDAVIGVAAGAEYRQGKEPKSMYGEPWAPDKPNPHTMGDGLKFFAKDTGSPQSFAPPPWAYKFPTCESFGPGRHPELPTSIEIGSQWKIELGGTRDTYVDAEPIRDDLLRLIYGLWDHLKNHCTKEKQRAANYRLVWVSYVAGKRENRRLIGDYVLTQNDIADQTPFADRVAFGAWSVDDHYSAGFFYKGPTARHLDDPDHDYKGRPFSIPFRCLYSKNVDNLLMAGRDISASHLALADTRVMLTCATLGQAVGTGAALCAQLDVCPRGLCQDHLKRLQQQLLKEGASILDLAADDPRDLARRAKVSASSVRTHTSGELMAAENVINGYARAVGPRGQETTNAWGPKLDAAGPHWIELAWPEPVTFDMVHVTFQTAALSPRHFTVEVRRQGKRGQSPFAGTARRVLRTNGDCPLFPLGPWQQVADVTDNRHRRNVLGLDRVTASGLRVVLDEPAAICEIRVYDEPQREVEIARRAWHNMRLPDKGPWLPWGDDPNDLGPAHRVAHGGIDPSRLDGVILDDAEAATTGLWGHSAHTAPFIWEGYITDGNEAKGAKSVRFRPRLPKSGRYEVRIAYSAGVNRATNTPVTIRSSQGSTTVRVNQRETPPIDNLLLSLGTFPLDAHSTVIEITNADTDGYVVVDAVQLIAVP